MKGTQFQKANSKNKKIKRNNPAWKTQPPKKGESNKKMVVVNSKELTYNWCPYHQKWMIHQPKDYMFARKGKSEKKDGERATIRNFSRQSYLESHGSCIERNRSQRDS
jgi:hypothetical protein